MSNLTMVEATLPPGFRFHPRDDELICDYLSNKVNSNLHDSPLLVEVDLNKCEPWDLPETACVGGKEWYFYSQRDRKYATGLRTNRATVSGYWKATGKDRCVLRNRTLVGMRKTLVFYLGRAPKGKKTDWVMHEFRLQGPIDSSLKEDWVLCRVFCKKKESSTGGGGKQISNDGDRYHHHEDTLSCSSSLPPLMEPYSLSFDQSQPTTIYNNEQVPCFSNNMINISNDPQIFDFNNNFNPNVLFFNPKVGLTSQLIPSSSSSSCEKKEVIKAVLSRFTQMDHNHKESTTSFGEGISDQSFLSDDALPVTMWYP